jgi:hypothetical protein
VNRHVELVGLLHLIWGGLGILVGVSLILLALGAGAIAVMPAHADASVAAGLTGLLLGGTGVALIGAGFLCLWIGVGLRRHRAAARIAALALAVLNLFLLPFGTALAIYTLWTLVHHDAHALFEPVII